MNTSAEPANNQVPPSAGERKRPLTLALVCGAVAALLLLGGSLFWALQAGGNTRGHGQPRAIVPSPTTAVPTGIPPEVTPPTNAIFYDAFLTNAHGWSLSGSDGYFRILVNNTLILADTNPNTPVIESVPTSVTLDTYVISVDFTINRADAGDSIGLYLRGDGTLDHDYRVDINSDATLDLAKEWLDASKTARMTMLVPSLRTSLLHPPGQQNTLTAFAIGPTLTVELNGFLVASIEDSSYASGQVALFARHGSSPDGVIVSFTRVEIDRVGSPFASPTPTPTPTATTGAP
jgi:hypothetical protein